MQKLLKGSFIILIGTIIFRIGGYLYRVLMQYLLGVEGYGISKSRYTFSMDP